MGTVTLLVDDPQEQAMAEQTQHMAEEVQEIYGFSSPLEALMNGVRMQLEAKKMKTAPIEKMKRLHEKVRAMRSPEYHEATDEEIASIRLDISGGL